MNRFLRAWWFACLFVLTLSPAARAEELHVCVRPPDVPAGVGRWAYGRQGQTILKSDADFRAQAKGLTVYVLDPAALPQSVQLLPARHHGLACPGAKPASPSPPPSASGSAAETPRPTGGGPTAAGGQGSGSAGSGQGNGQPRSAAEKAASELAYGAAIASGQLNENDKRPDGKKYGVIGGNNPNGPNNPIAQATASLVVIVASVVSVDAFGQTLKDALTKKVRLIFTEKSFGTGMLDLILQSKRAKFLADALAKNGAIGPYSVMSRFTQKLGGQWQAHHILEKQMFKNFRLGNADLGPSVILTDAEHKVMTAALAGRTPKAKTTQELWKAYQEVYKDYPHWLEAIKPYFVKRK